jgi:Ferritin-like domain
MQITRLSRGELLRLGAAGALLTAAPAHAAGPPPAPQGDDIGFLQWGATAELVSVAFWDRALEADAFGARVRRWMTAMRTADRQHLTALSTVLADEAPTEQDFEVVLPRRAFGSRAGILALGAEIEESITRAYLAGVTEAIDPATRLLLGKLLVQDVAHLDAVRSLDGSPSAFAGQRAPLGLEQAGEWLDRHLRVRS